MGYKYIVFLVQNNNSGALMIFTITTYSQLPNI